MDTKHTITLKPSGISFTVNTGQTILQAALLQNIALPYSCKTGKCDTCICVVSTETDTVSTIKTCTTKPNQDMAIEVDLLAELSDIYVKTLPCRINSIEQVTQDVVILNLRMPPNQILPFVAGQYIDLIKGDIRRSYSIASSPEENTIELHVRKVEQGRMSEYLFNHAKENDLLRIEGPFGTFFRRKKSVNASRPLIFLAGGTGFAPVQSIVKDILIAKENISIWIYWGNQTEGDFYCELPREWQVSYSQLNYIPVCSDRGTVFNGRKGLVHKAVLADFPDLRAFDVFACGNPAMIDAARSDFMKAGLCSSAFYADAFLPSV